MHTCVSQEWVEKNIARLHIASQLPVSKTHVVGAGGHKSPNIKNQLLIRMKILHAEFLINCLVVKGLIKPIIIGMQTLAQMKATIHIADGSLSFCDGDGKPFKVLYNSNNNECNDEHGPTNVTFIDVQSLNMSPVFKTTLSGEQWNRFHVLVNSFKGVFSDLPGRLRDFEYELRVSPQITNFKARHYPVPVHLRDRVRAEIERMQEIGVLEKCHSSFINPLRIVHKQDGSLRLCLDARNLNQYLLDEPEGPPGLDNVFAMFQGAQVFTSFDLTNSFWQVPLAKSSRKYTAFLFENQVFAFKVVPFGLKSSTSALLRALGDLFPLESATFCLRFVDEILIFSQSLEDHFHHIEFVLRMFSDNGLTIKLGKTQWLKAEVKFLGYILSGEGLKADPERVQAILEYECPKNLKQLRAFIGFINFYRRFQPNLASLVEPLTYLLKKGIRWVWTEEMQNSFEKIKQAFAEHVKLCLPVMNRTFYLSTDASGKSVAAHLYQIDEEGSPYPIAFVSRLLNEHERRYSISELELLAIHFGINKFRMWLQGTKFVVRTDHRALEHLQTSVLNSPRLSRLILSLQEFNYKIEYVPGNQNEIADCLSRFTSRLSNDPPDPGIPIFIIQDSPEIQEIFENFSNLQRSDSRLRYIRERVGKGGIILRSYRLQEEILYHLVRERWKIEIPSSVVDKLILYVHNKFLHSGVKKTLHILKESFTFKSLRKRTRALIKSCNICQRVKGGTYLHAPALSVPSDSPRNLVAIDFYGPLPETPNRFKFIIVVLDIATKFVRLYPVIKASGAAVLDCLLLDYMPRYGQIRKVMVDNGTQFTSALWRSKLRIANIECTHIAIRHPSANPAERYMKSLGQYMRVALFHRPHDQWHLMLPHIEECFNDSYHTSTQAIPSELFLGRRVEREWDSYFPVNIDRILTPELLSQEIAAATGEARRQSQLRARQEDNIHKSFTEFGEGDLVWIRARNISSPSARIFHKFLPQYIGPYIILRTFGNGSYLLGTRSNNIVKGVYNVTHLKKYHPPVTA
uniref:RNA-directed DNA polymerase n=1 Tax=Lygus hesperus TaxID=30085 RepID=A0A0A9VWG3_LYGHE